MKIIFQGLIVLVLLSAIVYVSQHKDQTLEQIAKQDSAQLCEDNLGCPK